MSETPRTDARILRDAYIEDGYTHEQEWIGDVVSAAFAKELERENAALRAELAKCRAAPREEGQG